MKPVLCFVLFISFLIYPVLAIDTSNWVNVTSSAGISFGIPPSWAWDPINQTSLGIRTEKSDAFLIISYSNITSPNSVISKEELETQVKNGMIDLNVPNVENITYENNTVTATGTNLAGTIINYMEKYDQAHLHRWVSEYSDNDSVLKYADTIHTIINNTQFIHDT